MQSPQLGPNTYSDASSFASSSHSAPSISILSTTTKPSAAESVPEYGGFSGHAHLVACTAPQKRRPQLQRATLDSGTPRTHRGWTRSTGRPSPARIAFRHTRRIHLQEI